jgi:hypothetical protein
MPGSEEACHYSGRLLCLIDQEEVASCADDPKLCIRSVGRQQVGVLHRDQRIVISRDHQRRLLHPQIEYLCIV